MTFDVNNFLDATTTEAGDTKIIPVPEGVYLAVCSKVAARTWQSKDGMTSGLTLDLVWDIDDQSVRDATGRDKVAVKQGIMLDLKEDGGLDFGKGKNVALGRAREAVGLNEPGKPFAPSMFNGRMCKVLVKQRVVDQDIFNDVKGNLPA